MIYHKNVPVGANFLYLVPSAREKISLRFYLCPGLASTEDFTSVQLRRGQAVPHQNLLPYRDKMLLQVRYLGFTFLHGLVWIVDPDLNDFRQCCGSEINFFGSGSGSGSDFGSDLIYQ